MLENTPSTDNNKKKLNWGPIIVGLLTLNIIGLAVLGALIAFPSEKIEPNSNNAVAALPQASTGTLILPTSTYESVQSPINPTIDITQLVGLIMPMLTVQPSEATQSPEITASVITPRAILRKGPGESYRMQCYLGINEILLVVGRNDDGSWLKIQLLPEQKCYFIDSQNTKQFIAIPPGIQLWISRPSVNLPNKIAEICVVTSPPTETPNPFGAPVQSKQESDDEPNQKPPNTGVLYPYP